MATPGQLNRAGGPGQKDFPHSQISGDPFSLIRGADIIPERCSPDVQRPIRLRAARADITESGSAAPPIVENIRGLARLKAGVSPWRMIERAASWSAAVSGRFPAASGRAGERTRPGCGSTGLASSTDSGK
jgi:hypothetical protein